jgi:iron complex outermembrane receptor protein
MNQLRQPSQRVSHCFVVSVLSLAVSSAIAQEAKAPTDEKVVAGVQAISAVASSLTNRAANAAPTKAYLDAAQPKSSISRDFIENSSSPVADFSAIAAIAPSVTLGISTNGPGLGETKNGIRGFKDGEFNITFDGIPFGDTNGPTHHSTAYFPASVIGEVVVERGPGKASDLGQATFGGSINLFSRPIANEAVFSPYFSFGTWNTKLVGARYDSGLMRSMGDAKWAGSYQKQTSDGYQTFSGVQGENLMVKFQKPIAPGTVMTINMNYNKNWYRTSDVVKGLTAVQADTLGRNYLLSDDPNKANFYGYNQADKTTVMNYLRFESDLGAGWGLDNNTYYYNYTNSTRSSSASDVTTGLGSVVTNISGTTRASQMPGYIKTNEYKVWGNIFKLTKDTSLGLARVGLWFEQADTHRSLYDYNLLDGTPNFIERAVPGVFGGRISNVAYDQDSGWEQYQPFAELEWNATSNLQITPGIKYMHTTLKIDALLNQTARISQNVSKDFTATLPFLTANYKLAPQWALYAQYAKGMLVPNIGNYQSTGADATNLTPQRSTNYQVGIVHSSGPVVFDADIYYIDFNNKIATVPGTSGANAVLFNQGGVVYKGAETQITYAFDFGLSLYVNGSINRAESKATKLAIAGVPDGTSAIGLIYRKLGWNAALINKRVGRTWALDNAAYQIDPYSSLDFNLGYTFTNLGGGFKNLKASIGVFNIANKESILSVSARNSAVGSATYGTVNAGDTFTYQPKRSSMISLKAEF